MNPSPYARARFIRICLAVATVSTVLVAGAPAVSARAVTTVTTDSGAEWQVHDAAPPGLDTGSIRTLSDSRVDGYGNLFLHVDTADPIRMNDQMLRGFGLAETAPDTFDSTTAVALGPIAVTRALDITGDDTARFFDTFTNTGDEVETIEVSFGGALGSGWGDQQGAVIATSDGDAKPSTDDSWTLVAQTSAEYRPVGTVLGAPGMLSSVGNQERNPFETPYDSNGQAANFYGYVSTLTIAPGETRSLLRFVAAGSVGLAPEQSALSQRLENLSDSPRLDGLSIEEVCSITNWDLPKDGCAQHVSLALPGLPAPTPSQTSVDYDIVSKSIADLHADLTSGEVTSVEVTQAYLDRIAAYDGGQFGFNAFITVASDALDQASAADQRRQNGEDSPLLGIPIAVKDLYDTFDMPTTGGSLALEGYQPDRDAYQVARLREAGAVILGKTNMSEFALSGNYSESGYGQTWNALNPSKTSFGSSGGSAVAVATSMAAAAMGSQTGNSLWGPAAGAGLTMFRGTDGMASLSGVMPLSLGYDYAGPIAQNVTDLSYILNAVTGTDSEDVLTQDADAHRPEDWTSMLDPAALQGVRVGYVDASFTSQFTDDGTGDALRSHFADLEAAGATVVQLAGAPTEPKTPFANYWDRGFGEGWSRYITAHADFPYPSAGELYSANGVLAYNRAAITDYGPMSEEELAAYLDHRDDYRDTIAAWMDENKVDVLVYPGYISDHYNNDGYSRQHAADRETGIITSDAGLPTVMVPVGANPAGYSISFQLVGREWDDANVLAMAYALEQTAAGRQETTYAPALELNTTATPTPEPTTSPLPSPTESTPTPTPAPTPTESTPIEPTPTPPLAVLSENEPSNHTPAGTGTKTGNLATTGSMFAPLITALGITLLGGGAAILFARRRRA